MVWFVMFIMALLGGIVQVVAGFGAAVVMMLALPSFFGMVTASAISGAICVGMVVPLAWKYRRHFNPKSSLVPIVAYLLVSMPIIALVPKMDLDSLKVAFGAFLVLMAVYFLVFSKKIHVEANWRTGVVCGGFSGLFAGLFGVGGPLIALYFVSATKTKDEFIANSQALFAITFFLNTLQRFGQGLFTVDLISITLLGLAAITLGKWLGLRIIDRMDGDMIRKVVYICVGLCGLLTIVQNL